MLPRFFCPDLAAASPILEGDELHHLHQVRRLGPGDQVELFDGRGGLARCAVVIVAKRRAEFEVIEATTAPPPACRLTIATAIPKGARMDTLVEKVTELGAAAIWPLATARASVTDCGQEKQRGWQRRAVAACKQSGLLWLPDILAPQTLAEAVAALRQSPFDLVLLADPSPEAAPLADALARLKSMVGRADRVTSRASAVTNIAGFVGPEGGFTDEERAALVSAGAVPVRLTSTILRIETAAIALAAALMVAGPRR